MVDIEKHYQEKARRLVDELYNNGLFNDSLTRQDLQLVEDIIADDYQTTKDSVKRYLEMNAKRQKIKKSLDKNPLPSDNPTDNDTDI